MKNAIRVAVAASALLLGSVQAQTVNVDGAEALLKKSGCTKCHAVNAKKDGPSFKDVAARYRGKPDAEALVTKQITTNPVIKIDGQEERHDALKTKNEAEIKNAAAYILSR